MPLWAVHISDGLLSWNWLAAGFAGAAVLIILGVWRIPDEEIPPIALVTAAFFVASFIHVRVGPSSVHLLLNGLVGVVLGQRAGLSIFIALFMQAVLAGHGGYYTLGVNTCVMALPALIACLMFAGLLRLPVVAKPWFRTGLVVFCSVLWMLSLVFGVSLLALNPGGQVSHLPIAEAGRLTLHPVTLGGVLILAVAAGWLERRLENTPEFPLGLLVGETAVLLAAFLNAVVLIEGGVEDWPALALVSLVPHVFLAALEGLIVGFTVGFLARVKPELLRRLAPGENSMAGRLRFLTWLATVVVLALPGPLLAHRLELDFKILPDRKVQIEGSYETLGRPQPAQGAEVKVFRPDGQVLTDGTLDEKGMFTFSWTIAEDLKVVVVQTGHREPLLIPAHELDPSLPPKKDHSESDAKPAAHARDGVSHALWRDLFVGVGFLLALAAFLIGLRNAAAIRKFTKM